MKRIPCPICGHHHLRCIYIRPGREKKLLPWMYCESCKKIITLNGDHEGEINKEDYRVED